MTFEEAQQLVQIFNDPPDTMPHTAMLCTCFLCMRDYAQHFAIVFPQFDWMVDGDPEDKDHGLLRVEEKQKD